MAVGIPHITFKENVLRLSQSYELKIKNNGDCAFSSNKVELDHEDLLEV